MAFHTTPHHPIIVHHAMPYLPYIPSIHPSIHPSFRPSVRACMHIYIYSYICTCSFIYLCICKYIHPYIHTFIHSYIHAFIHSCIHIFTHSYIHTFIHAYSHTFMHACMHAYIHSHVYTYNAYMFGHSWHFMTSLSALFMAHPSNILQNSRPKKSNNRCPILAKVAFYSVVREVVYHFRSHQQPLTRSHLHDHILPVWRRRMMKQWWWAATQTKKGRFSLSTADRQWTCDFPQLSNLGDFRIRCGSTSDSDLPLKYLCLLRQRHSFLTLI